MREILSNDPRSKTDRQVKTRKKKMKKKRGSTTRCRTCRIVQNEDEDLTVKVKGHNFVCQFHRKINPLFLDKRCVINIPH